MLFTACKKDHVDATNTKTLQSSINAMTSSLPTIKQIKFNEALYILKTFEKTRHILLLQDSDLITCVTVFRI